MFSCQAECGSAEAIAAAALEKPMDNLRDQGSGTGKQLKAPAGKAMA